MKGRKAILCVDDEDAVLLTLKLLLESAGFRVITASSATEALHAFSAEHVDAAVLDYWMPQINGIQLATRLKHANPSLPVIFLSAFSELPGETIGLAEAWIKKGEEDPRELLGKLRNLVDRDASSAAGPAA